MATKKLGNLIKKARTDAGLTQEQLAKKVSGLTAADIGKAERAEKDLTETQLKAIAKATGVTQKSLLDAAGKSTASSAAKTGSAKTTSAKASSSKTASGSSMKLTANEKKLVELYREADAETKKQAMKVLKGEGSDASDLMKKVLGSKAISNVVTQMIKNSTK